MKKILPIILGIVLVATLVFVDSMDLFSPKAYANEGVESPYVEVYGNGTLEVEPNVAYISIGVTTENDDAEEAQNLNKEKMNKVIEALKENGITKEDMKTLNYSMNKRFRYLKNNEKEPYYSVYNTLKVTVKDIEKVGEIIDVSSKAGSNRINSVQFSVLEDSEYYNKALKIAMEDAKGKASSILSTMDKTVDTPSVITEVSSNQGILRNYDQTTLKSNSMAEASTPIEAGDIKIKARVKVKYNY